MGRKKKRNKAARLAPAPTKPVPVRRSRWPWICLGLILLFVVIVRVRLLPVPLERDEGEYAYAGQLILDGIPPYQLVYNVKLPGIYAAYASLMAIFGQTTFGIHLGLLFVNLGAVILIFFLARRLFDAYAAVIASATYALMSTSPAVMGSAAHATHFVILAALGGFLVLLRGLESRRALTLFWSGLLFGIAVLMKQHGVFLGVFAFGVLLYNEWSSKIAANSAGSSAGSLQYPGTDAKKSLLPGLRRLAVFSFGTVVPYALTCLILWRAGVFDKFWQWTVVYASGHSLRYSFQSLASYFQSIVGDDFFWGLGAVGFFFLCADRAIPRWTKGFVAGLFVASFLAVSPGFYFFPHYFVLMLPAVGLLVGAGCTLVRQKLRRSGLGAFGSIVPAAVFLAGCGMAISKHERFHWSYFEGSHVAFVAAPELAHYISNHSSPASRVAVLGSEPEIYFYAHRHAASGYIYMYDITSRAVHAPAMKQEMFREIEAAQPEFVLDVHDPFSWSVGFSPAEQSIREWLDEYLKSGNYQRVAVAENVAGQIVYRWDANAAGYSPASKFYISVYQRKP